MVRRRYPENLRNNDTEYVNREMDEIVCTTDLSGTVTNFTHINGGIQNAYANNITLKIFQ